MIEIYSSNTCAYCQQAKEFFKMKGLEYVEKNISDNKDYRIELMKAGYRSVPVIKIGEEYIVGFNPVKINELVG